jgi:hypothetical protein
VQSWYGSGRTWESLHTRDDEREEGHAEVRQDAMRLQRSEQRRAKAKQRGQPRSIVEQSWQTVSPQTQALLGAAIATIPEREDAFDGELRQNVVRRSLQQAGRRIRGLLAATKVLPPRAHRASAPEAAHGAEGRIPAKVRRVRRDSNPRPPA